MGNCPTVPSEAASKSLDPNCHGQRMWTTFLFSSLLTLFGGWFIISLYDGIKALANPLRRSQLIMMLKRIARVDEVT